MSYNIKKLDWLPDHVLAKAYAEIDRIAEGGKLKPEWRKMNKNSRLHRFKLTQKYRMVVGGEQIREGPYLCMNHGTFDKRY